MAFLNSADEMPSFTTPLELDEDREAAVTPAPLSMSPNKIRMRIDAAKEQAKVVNAVYEQGEVVHWMSVRSPELVAFGRRLEQRGFTTLGSIAFLTEDDLPPDVSAGLKHTLLVALAELRHELYRM
ncbi:hypothetical protein SPRG_11869 [Saprolegnia parasitica CBS 223.65]|uniref:Uncharacterized protein n=1 Tax=Saprolegnia parasitica (strain CBS 223.65) TaxID=695850 RepID=A0A067C873_SAPPC|nr:hypothetical protein SPRG_11869 [Saprolegnia parasitica CBS 223.65]KDO23022.1 hypothetical protein SPRG_11869 [Saprolegnia parasitica CBS 223.65]|eukprot:XP_012206310.1 hypothetical protein SPRG_11869 [Saprolegnia parasitica CBS 223.65]